MKNYMKPSLDFLDIENSKDVLQASAGVLDRDNDGFDLNDWGLGN